MREAPEAEAHAEQEATGRSQDPEIGPGERQAFRLARVGRGGWGVLTPTAAAAGTLLKAGYDVARASIVFIAA
jgi:hypothetical protein